MMGLRPILSDSEPKITKNGVPMISETAIRMLAVAPSSDHALQEEQRVELTRVPDHGLADGQAQREQHDLEVLPLAEGLGERRLGLLALAL